jgi:hypothetical protein
MEEGHLQEAADVDRADLGLNERLQRCAQHPCTVWAMHGFVECLRNRGDTDELPHYADHLTDALAKTDVPITSSCLCRTNVASCCDK